MLCRLAATHDYVMVQEAHGQEGGDAAFEPPSGTRAFWSHDKANRGGLLLLVQEAFLKQFAAVRQEDWDEIVPGRFAALTLRGPSGDISIGNVYMPTGHHRDARQPIMYAIRAWAVRNESALLSLAGDFNFALRDADRFDRNLMQNTGFRDAVESDFWQNTILKGTTLQEAPQAHHTHHSRDTTARLDLAYTSHHTADYFQGSVYVGRLTVDRDASDHDAISYGRRRAPKEDGLWTVSDYAIDSADWPERVATLFHERAAREHHLDHNRDALDDLMDLKTAMRTVSESIMSTRGGRDPTTMGKNRS